MADLPEGENVQCGRCQSLHDLGAVLDSGLDYWAVCESFVAACPRCTAAIVLDVGDAGGAVSVGHVWGRGARPDVDYHQQLSVPSLFAAFGPAGPVLCCRGRVWLPGARAAGFPNRGADLPQLARLAQRADTAARRTAVELIRVVGRHDPDQAAGALRQALHDDDAGVMLAAASGLLELAPNAARSEVDRIVPLLLRAGSTAQCVALGDPALRVAVGMLGDAGPPDRRSIVRYIGACGNPTPEALDALARAFADEDAAVRREAVIAARRLGPAARHTLPALVSGFGCADGEFRKLCLIAIAETAGPDAAGVGPVVEALGDPDPELRREAARVLGGVGPAAAAASPSLVRLLSDVDSSVRVQAAYALGKLGPAARDALPELRRLLQDPHHRVRAQAGVAIRQVEGEAHG
jgi:HEAT repeat protein